MNIYFEKQAKKSKRTNSEVIATGLASLLLVYTYIHILLGVL